MPTVPQPIPAARRERTERQCPKHSETRGHPEDDRTPVPLPEPVHRRPDTADTSPGTVRTCRQSTGGSAASLHLQSLMPFVFLPFLQKLRGLPFDLGNVDSFLGHLVERRKLAKLGYNLHHFVGHIIDFFLRRKAPQAEADRRMRQILTYA